MSPLIAYEDAYRDFFGLMVNQIAGAISSAEALLQAQARAEALADLDRAKSAFFSNVSHEFRTPLTLMLGPLEQLLEHEPDPARAIELETARRNTLRLQRLVDTLLDFSRIEAHRGRPAVVVTDLSSFTRDLVCRFTAAFNAAGVGFEVHVPKTEVTAAIDRGMYEKIVLNLVSNALKFTLEGRVAITVTRRGNDVVLSVRDSGVGIALDDLPHIFERFYRAENRDARSFEGTGIGLALVKEFVHLHGGTIDVESALERGTTFTVVFPGVMRPREHAQPAEPDASTLRQFLADTDVWSVAEMETGDGGAAPRATARVLVVDDNADLRAYLRRVLGATFNVEIARDGVEALAIVAKRPPDIVITDAMIPKMDGFTLIGELRSKPLTQRVPIVVLSARAGEEARAEGLDRGADAYLVKPFSTRELISTVVAVLRTKAVDASVLRSVRESERRSFIATLTQSLADSLDVDETVNKIVRSCVPTIADGAALYLTYPDEILRLARVWSGEGRYIDDIRHIRERFPVREGEPVARVAATGIPRLIGEMNDAALLELAGNDSAHYQRLRAMNLRSAIMVPMSARGRSIGALIFAYDQSSERRYHDADVPIAVEVGSRAAIAIENAMRYEREHRVSETFQNASLPPTLPSAPGLYLSAKYEAGRSEALVGGDWFDAFRLHDGRLILSVGDVAGNGLDAAVTMGSVRQSIRTAAVINPDPLAVLNAVDRVVREMSREKYVTAFVGIFDPLYGELRYATAGHPPPLLRDPSGKVTALASGGLPLGLRLRTEEPSRVIDLEPGSLLLLYTDGLTEVGRNALEGERRVADALGDLQPTRDAARRLYDAVIAHQETRDDIAILALWYESSLFELDSGRCARQWIFKSDDGDAASNVRREYIRKLQDAGLNEEDLRVGGARFRRVDRQHRPVRAGTRRCQPRRKREVAGPQRHRRRTRLRAQPALAGGYDVRAWARSLHRIGVGG